MKLKFYKTAKNFIKKKKTKSKTGIKKKEKKEDNEDNEEKEDNEENEENEEDLKFVKTLSGKLKSKKKKSKSNKLLMDKIKDNDNENEGLDEDNNNDDNDNEEIDINDFGNSEIDWTSIKKEFLTTIEKNFHEINLYEHIDIALVSTITLSKKEYGDFKIKKHHIIYPIKNFNNINWAKDPYCKLRDKFYDMMAPGKLISKNHCYDFGNRVCNEYEIYNAQIPLIRASGNDILEKVEPQDFFFLPKEGQPIMKPHLLLFFSFNDEKSILFYKEVLEYLKENGDKFIFLPVYAEIIQAQKNIYYVTEMLSKYKVYKKGDQFDIYFCSHDKLNSRFKYISDDNKRTITCKTAFIDIINDKFIVRAIRELDSFTFNLIEHSGNRINKEKYKTIVKNLQIFKQKSKKKLKNIPLIEPYSCKWILKKAKIYTISKNEKKLKLNYTLYDSLTGKLNCHNIYKSSEKDYQKLSKLLNDLFYYKLRTNPKSLRLTYKQKNNLIIEEMKKCLKMNEEIKNVTYQGIFQTQKIIMSLGSDFDIEQKFEPLKSKSFKLEVHLDINLFDELIPQNMIGSLYALTLFSYFNNCDYIACLPKIGEKFPDKLNLTDHKTLKDIQIPINPDENKPSLLVIFSLAFQNYFAPFELSSRFKNIIRKLSSFYEKNSINIILIFRGEPSLFSQRFEQIKDDPIFDFDFPLYIQSSSDMKFPLLFQNNDIESTDSQIFSYILNKKNTLVYTGNLEDIELDKTFQQLCNDKTGNINDILVYKEYANLAYEDFKNMINPVINQIEEIIEEEIQKEKLLLYRPFFSLSYNTYTNFKNDKTDNEKYINHIRLRILVKERHENIFSQNKQYNNLIAQIKKYGASSIVLNIPCEDLEFEKYCSNCKKKIIDIDENEPVYYDEETKKIFCEKCGEDFSNDIKNDSYVTFINTKEYTQEIISEIYENYNKRNVYINPVLGNICKICQNKIGSCYYLNLTNFNINYIESPLTPIDVCESCFLDMRNGDPFLNDPLKRLNYKKLGLNYKHMIYRKIYIPLIGE